MKLKKLSIVKAIQRKIRHRELIREFNDATRKICDEMDLVEESILE